MVQNSRKRRTPEEIKRIFARVHNIDPNCRRGGALLHAIGRLTEMPLGALKILKLRDVNKNVPR